MSDDERDCIAAMKLLFDYLDGELDEAREAAIRAHLAICAECYPHYEFEKLFLEALAATCAENAAPPTLRERVVTSLRSAGFRA
jgi:mycothiol system anti-sigma-R factor